MFRIMSSTVHLAFRSRLTGAFRSGLVPILHAAGLRHTTTARAKQAEGTRRSRRGFRPSEQIDCGYIIPRLIQLQWNTPPSTTDTAVARAIRIIMAGRAAIAHLTSRTTMDQNGILTSTTTTSLVSLLIGGLLQENER